MPHSVKGLYSDLSQAQAASGSVQTGDELLPVMIWVHGGGYSSGYAALYPAFKLALEQSIIVVVIQYRLGYMGFLASGDDTLKGNFGLWDQRLAMLWVKDNIRAFGGDNMKITAAGNSAGAASVSQQSISRQSSGIFQNVVMMSGAASCSWAVDRNPKMSFDQFADGTGCGGLTSMQDTVDCLRNKNVEALAQGAQNLYFVPVIDGEFLADTAENLLKDQAYLDSIGYYNYTFLNGVVNNEGAVVFLEFLSLIPDLGLTIPDEFVDNYVMGMAVDGYLGQAGPDVRDAVDFHYFYPRDPVTRTVPTKRVLELLSDEMFVVPTINLAGHYSKVADTASSVPSAAVSSTVYTYLFDWYPDLSAGTPLEGLFHGLDNFYLFGLSDQAKYIYSGNGIVLPGTIQPEDYTLSFHFGNIIGSFVRTGDPNNGISEEMKGKWRPYDIINETYYVISPTPSVEEHMYAKRVSLWNDLVPRLQARFLQEMEAAKTTSPYPTTAPPANGEQQKFSQFSLTEDEANSLITALIVICVILAFLLIVTGIIAVVFWRRDRASTYSM